MDVLEGLSEHTQELLHELDVRGRELFELVIHHPPIYSLTARSTCLRAGGPRSGQGSRGSIQCNGDNADWPQSKQMDRRDFLKTAGTLTAGGMLDPRIVVCADHAEAASGTVVRPFALRDVSL